MAYNELVDKSPATGVGTTPIALIESNPGRKLLIIYNASGVFIGYAPRGIVPSVNASGNGGIGTTVLGPNQGIILDTAPVPTNAFDVVAESGSSNHVTVQEL